MNNDVDSPEWVQNKFLRAVWTGFISGNVKYQLRTYCDDVTVTKEVSIVKTNETASFEAQKLKARF